MDPYAQFAWSWLCLAYAINVEFRWALERANTELIRSFK